MCWHATYSNLTPRQKTEQFDVWIALLCHHIQKLEPFKNSPFLANPVYISAFTFKLFFCHIFLLLMVIMIAITVVVMVVKCVVTEDWTWRVKWSFSSCQSECHQQTAAICRNRLSSQSDLTSLTFMKLRTFAYLGTVHSLHFLSASAQHITFCSRNNTESILGYLW